MLTYAASEGCADALGILLCSTEAERKAGGKGEEKARKGQKMEQKGGGGGGGGGLLIGILRQNSANLESIRVLLAFCTRPTRHSPNLHQTDS